MAITSLHMNWGTRCPKGSRAHGPFCCGCCRPSSSGRPAFLLPIRFESARARSLRDALLDRQD